MNPQQIAQQMDQQLCKHCKTHQVEPGKDLCSDCIIPCAECGDENAHPRKDIDNEYYCDNCYQEIQDLIAQHKHQMTPAQKQRYNADIYGDNDYIQP